MVSVQASVLVQTAVSRAAAGAAAIRRTVGFVAVAVFALSLTGCGTAVHVADPAITGQDTEVCGPLLAALPAEVLGSVTRDTTSQWGRAWGDPPITVICGGPEPAGLTATSQCLEVSGVGWWEQAGDRGTVWTTIGRAAVVTLGVPSEYGDPISALAQVSPAIAEHNPEVRPCV